MDRFNALQSTKTRANLQSQHRSTRRELGLIALYVLGVCIWTAAYYVAMMPG